MTKPIVIKIGGSTLEDIQALTPLWQALVALNRPTILVHGGGKAVDALLSRLNLPVERREGLRVTPPDQMDLIAGVLAGTVNKKLVGAINAAGGRAVGLCLGDGQLLTCVQKSESLGRVGEVTSPARSGGGIVTTLLAAGFLPIISSIGIDASGGLLNLNADDAAAGLAKSLSASTLVLLTDVPGIKGGDGKLRPTLSPHQIESMIQSNEITGGMIVKARSAVHAAQSTGAAVVILSGERPDALQAYLAGQQVGTTIVG